MEEIFKQSFVNGLLISNLGTVKEYNTGYILKQFKMKNGYNNIKYKGYFWGVHLMIGNAFIDNPDNKPIIDHIDNNRLNNNLNNLRWATSKENAHNRVLYKNNTSGYKGVYWNKEKKKWYAMICEDYKLKNLGYFDSKEDAIKKRLTTAKELMGDFINKCELITTEEKDDDIKELEELEKELETLLNKL